MNLFGWCLASASVEMELVKMLPGVWELGALRVRGLFPGPSKGPDQ